MSDISTLDKPQAPALPDQRTLEDTAEQVLAFAKSLGATDAEVGVGQRTGLSVNVRKGEVETLEHERDRSLSVTLFVGQRKGNASTSDFSAKGWRDAVEAAYRIARYTSEDRFAGLADKDELATDLPDLDLYHPWGISPDEAVALAKLCEQAALESDDRISNSDGAGVSTSDSVNVYANSRGFMGGRRGSRHSMSCMVLAGQGDAMQRDYDYTVSRVPAELADAEAVGRRAAERTLARMGAKRVPTAQAPVLFDASVARGLIGHLLAAIRGGALYRKSSFLLDQLGQPVLAEGFSVEEKPLLPRGLGSAAFDNDGVATRERYLVRAGVLEGYLLDVYAARRLGMKSTGNAGGAHNVFVHGPTRGREELIKDIDRGLLVTELMGQGINMVTGDYSRGASGFWVEHGEIQYPVQEVTIAGNLKTMLKQLRAVGSDVDTRGNIQTGSLLVDGMTIAGE